VYLQEEPPGLHCVPGGFSARHRHCIQLPLFPSVS
jgi:hypothetical protein